MALIAADALKAATRNQFAIPAEQKTLQAKEETKRHYASLNIIALIVVGVFILLGLNVWRGNGLDGYSLLLLLALALVAIGGPPVADAFKGWLKSRSPST